MKILNLLFKKFMVHEFFYGENRLKYNIILIILKENSWHKY
jgi:hypothetical protein